MSAQRPLAIYIANLAKLNVETCVEVCFLIEFNKNIFFANIV
jgi:hypothetical protein